MVVKLLWFALFTCTNSEQGHEKESEITDEAKEDFEINSTFPVKYARGQYDQCPDNLSFDVSTAGTIKMGNSTEHDAVDWLQVKVDTNTAYYLMTKSSYPDEKNLNLDKVYACEKHAIDDKGLILYPKKNLWKEEEECQFSFSSRDSDVQVLYVCSLKVIYKGLKDFKNKALDDNNMYSAMAGAAAAATFTAGIAKLVAAAALISTPAAPAVPFLAAGAALTIGAGVGKLLIPFGRELKEHATKVANNKKAKNLLKSDVDALLKEMDRTMKKRMKIFHYFICENEACTEYFEHHLSSRNHQLSLVKLLEEKEHNIENLHVEDQLDRLEADERQIKERLERLELAVEHNQKLEMEERKKPSRM